MDVAALTPLQARVATELLDLGGPRPTFPAGLGARLRHQLEDDLRDTYGLLDLAGVDLPVRKGTLAKVLQCERHHVDDQGFPGWSAATARGAVVHKAVELGAFTPAPLPPLELVDLAIGRIVDDGDEWSPADWLETAGPAERAEVRAEASDLVAAFQDCFAALPARWRPRVESSVRVELFGGRITLRAKVDLALGQARGHEARVLLVDLKSGRRSGGHVDDLRFYALLETLKIGVPPFRVASLYLESGSWQVEDVTEDTLDTAARRVAAGVRRLADLQLGQRQPTITPGPTCGYCRLRDDCAGAATWAEEREQRGLEPVA